MDLDDLKPKPKPIIGIGDDFSTLSVAELEARLIALAEEIKRVEAEIVSKKARNAAADSLFKR